MKDSIKTSLDTMFEQNTASMGAAAELKRNKENSQDDFIADFIEARNEVHPPGNAGDRSIHQGQGL